MAQYWTYAKNGVSVTASTAQTLAEIVLGAGTMVKIIEWSVEFNQFNAAQPCEVEWISSTTALTSPSAVTAVAWQAGQGTARATVNAPGTENFTSSNLYANHVIPITSGLLEQFPYSRELEVPISTTSFRLRVTPGTTGGTCDWVIVIEE